MSLPIREGGLGVVEPSRAAESQYVNSIMITTPLVSILTGNSSATVLDAHDQILKAKKTVNLTNREQTGEFFDNIYQRLSAALKKCVGRGEHLPGFQQCQFGGMGLLYIS